MSTLGKLFYSSNNVSASLLGKEKNSDEKHERYRNGNNKNIKRCRGKKCEKGKITAENYTKNQKRNEEFLLLEKQPKAELVNDHQSQGKASSSEDINKGEKRLMVCKTFLSQNLVKTQTKKKDLKRKKDNTSDDVAGHFPRTGFRN